MTIKDIIKFRNPFAKEKPSALDVHSVDGFGITRPEIPVEVEKKNEDWVWLGDKNQYRTFLNEILNTSAIHNAIVKGKAEMMAGSGFLLNGATDKAASQKIYDSLDAETKKWFDLFFENPNDKPLKEVFSFASKTYQKNGDMAFEVIWSADFSRIATVKWVNTDNLCPGKMVNGKVMKYWYCRDWSKYKNAEFKPKEIPVFDPKEPEKDNKVTNQIYFIKSGTLEYYGEPSYKGGISWIKIDSQMGLFHLANIEHGFSPSLMMKFYKKPGSPEEKQIILENITRQWGGAKNAGKGLVFFSDGKDLSPDVEPVNVSGLDKQYLVLSDLSIQQILSAHGVTSPLLFGVSVPGKLGGSTELDVAYRIFDNSVIEPDRNKLEGFINEMLKVNKVNVTVEIAPFNPLEQQIVSNDNSTINALNSLSPLVANKVLESMSPEEIRALVGLSPITTAPPNPAL